MPRDPDQPRKPNEELTSEERGKILGALESGASQRKAAQITQCSRGAVRRVLGELSSNRVFTNGSVRINGQ